MNKYEAVVWESGLERYQGQLDVDDRAAIKSYLDRGGKLLFTSPRAAGALGDAPASTNPGATPDMPLFLRDYFGAAYVDTVQVGGGKVTGLGDIFGTKQFSTDVFPGRPLQDVFNLGASEIGTATAEAERIRELERENRELRRANEILKSASIFFAGELDPRPKR